MSKLIFIDCKWEASDVHFFNLNSDACQHLKYLQYKNECVGSQDLGGLVILLAKYLEELNLFGTSFYLSNHDIELDRKLFNCSTLKNSFQLFSCLSPDIVLKSIFSGTNISKVLIKQSWHFHCNNFYFNHSMWRKCLCHSLNFNFLLTNNNISWLHACNSLQSNICSQKNLSCITSVSLINCSIDDKSMRPLVQGLCAFTMEELVLDFNKISDVGAGDLSSLISKCSMLQNLFPFNAILLAILAL